MFYLLHKYRYQAFIFHGEFIQHTSPAVTFHSLSLLPVLYQILLRLSKLCVQEGLSGRKSKKQQQRLLRNMGAHAVVLELLQIPYEKVSRAFTEVLFNGVFFCAKVDKPFYQPCFPSREKICVCRIS